MVKLFYKEAGVREYWIVDTKQSRVLAYYFESDVYPVIYGMDKPVPIAIYNNKLSIDFSYVLQQMERIKE